MPCVMGKRLQFSGLGFDCKVKGEWEWATALGAVRVTEPRTKNTPSANSQAARPLEFTGKGRDRNLAQPSANYGLNYARVSGQYPKPRTN